MPKIHEHGDVNLDSEFDSLYQKLDLYIVSVTTPNQPRTGMQWFNPDTGKLQIFKNTQDGWEQIN
jgi:hypothetical protein